MEPIPDCAVENIPVKVTTWCMQFNIRQLDFQLVGKFLEKLKYDTYNSSGVIPFTRQ